ncbi:unnamed protein product [Haemonchus placei]|uniref:Secreted protein n=1 Tax=Haemonchus placei TaxID=6290 RepID=A0A0N4WGI4_HAEPC|nr:unnamed protein product [Haemonchus placei]
MEPWLRYHFLFLLALDVITCGLLDGPPNTVPHADDITLIADQLYHLIIDFLERASVTSPFVPVASQSDPVNRLRFTDMSPAFI